MGTIPYASTELKYQEKDDKYLRRASQLMGLRRAASTPTHLSSNPWRKWLDLGSLEPHSGSSISSPQSTTRMSPFMCARVQKKLESTTTSSHSVPWPRTVTLQLGSLDRPLQVLCFHNRWCQPEPNLLTKHQCNY